MNLYHTSGRNRLLITSVGDLLMIGINGPPLTEWNAQKYVISWLQENMVHWTKPCTGLPKKVAINSHSSKLFAKLHSNVALQEYTKIQ